MTESATNAMMRRALTYIALLIYNNFRSLSGLQRMAGDIVYRDVRRNYPPVLGERESIDVIIKEGASVGRFGDGELRLCRNKSLRFQPASPELVRRLKEVLHSHMDGFYAAIPRLLDDDATVTERYRTSFRRVIIRNSRITYPLNPSRRLSAFISRPQIYKWSCHEYDDYICAAKMLWSNRNVVLVGNKDYVQTLSSRNIFHDTKSLHFVETPTENAYGKYADILGNIKKHPNNCLFLLSCGPTATILAYDLHKFGRQAVDIGHLFLLTQKDLQNNSKD